MDSALVGIDYAQAYADDILVWSDGDEREHIKRVETVLERLRAVGSPYFLLYGRHPVYPEQARALLDGQSVDVDDDDGDNDGD